MRQIGRKRIFQNNCSIACRVAQDFSPDVAYIWQFDAIGIGLVQGLQRLAIPIVFNVGDSLLCDLMGLLRKDPHSFWRILRRALYGINVKELDTSHLIAVSGQLKEYYLQRGFNASAITVIHNGIDSSYIVSRPLKAGTGRKLLYAGRLDPTKGVDCAIRALAMLKSYKKGPFTLDIVGGGNSKYVGELKSLARMLDVERYLKFLGPTEREVLIGLYDEYDLLLFPSVWFEGFGLTIVEAMARGVPVVASNRGGPKDIISHMKDGLLVEPGQPKALTEAIGLLAERNDLREQFAKGAIKKVREQFTIEKTVDETENMLARIC